MKQPVIIGLTDDKYCFTIIDIFFFVFRITMLILAFDPLLLLILKLLVVMVVVVGDRSICLPTCAVHR